MLGHGLKEKTAIEAATKVQGDWYCQFVNLLVIIAYGNVCSKLDEKTNNYQNALTNSNIVVVVIVNS
jgi:hypothetical protein